MDVRETGIDIDQLLVRQINALIHDTAGILTTVGKKKFKSQSAACIEPWSSISKIRAAS